MVWCVCGVLGRCSAGEYECAQVNGGCVTSDQLCDGVSQCADGSDEDHHAGCDSSAASFPTRTSHCPCLTSYCLTCSQFISS